MSFDSACRGDIPVAGAARAKTQRVFGEASSQSLCFSAACACREWWEAEEGGDVPGFGDGWCVS